MSECGTECQSVLQKKCGNSESDILLLQIHEMAGHSTILYRMPLWQYLPSSFLPVASLVVGKYEYSCSILLTAACCTS